jgi:uracil-DNA glycosylase
MKKPKDSAEALIPEDPSLSSLRDAAADCQACDLFKNATQTVFGEGPAKARLMLVGEQPGNEEDLKGRPFVGPSGMLLDKALIAAGIDRGKTYVTGVVKHFKFVREGKRRIHEKPKAKEINSCRPWLMAEIAVVKPKVIVLLGATAAQALIDKDFRVTQRRGEFIQSPLAPHVMATVHPSSILRAIDEDARESEMQKFIEDLKVAARALSGQD